MTVVHSWIVLPIGVSLPSLEKKKFVKCVSSSFQIKSPYTSMALPVLGISAQVLIFGCPHAYFPIPEGPQLSKREPAY